MKKTNKKIFFAAVALLFLFPAFSFAKGYDFYVDKNSSETTEDGSQQYPFKTIGAALSHIQAEGDKGKTVYVKKGTYSESLSISNNTRLFGEEKSETIVDASGKTNAVVFVKTKSKMKNFTIRNANAQNVFVDKKSKVTIENCRIEKAGSFGIEVEKSSATDKYKFTIEDSEISENTTKGFHVSKRKINISKNDIFSNGEEGVDLHTGQKGTVSSNEIHENGESGIELILAGANLSITNNNVEKNETQGITVQAYSEKKRGKVKISGNTIEENDKYGIRYANYTRSIGPTKFKTFIDKCVKLSKNTLKDNKEGYIFYE